MAIGYRAATVADAVALAALEERCFDPARYDGILDRRRFRHLLTRGHAAIVVAVPDDGSVQGYALLLFRRGSDAARFYSLAVAPERRGDGLGVGLFAAAEKEALARGCRRMLLEIRADNHVLLDRYRRNGYRVFEEKPGYYPDGTAAIRMQRDLRPESAS